MIHSIVAGLTTIRVWLGVTTSHLLRLLTRSGGTPLTRGVVAVRASAAVAGAAFLLLVWLGVSTVHYVYLDRGNLPDAGPFQRFEFPSVGRIYDSNGQPLITLAREHREIVQFADIPPVVRAAILAAEDKRFFSHDGVDYLSLPRVISKVRVGAWIARLARGGWGDGTRGRAIFPQGGSTITQQLVRGVFLLPHTSRENSHELRSPGLLPRALSWVIGARNVNMLLRKREEIRLSLWIEGQMRDEFGSKRRAKEEILARYASFVYMGRGQYGFARAADYYFGRPLSTLTADDADQAALLAGIPKSPRDYAPTASGTGPILRRRNQILALMAAGGFLSPAELRLVDVRPLPVTRARASPLFQSSAVVQHVLDELHAVHVTLGIDDLLRGDIQVYSTVDARVQRIVSEALEHGLERYEQRHPLARGVIQGSIVVLRNGDGSVLAETGGRQVYHGRTASYTDFNRVTQSLRQPGSAMKPIVYLAAFDRGPFTLETMVPDDPISVPNGSAGVPKWIANYDGIFKGPIPIREALAQSRNAVAIWLTSHIGIAAVLRMSERVGIRTPLHPYATTALGASEVTLLELATVYRTIASGVLARPHVIQRVVLISGDVIPGGQSVPEAVDLETGTLALIQEGLRGVVRLPTGTAHALDSRAFPVAVMGKTGTTNGFRDALFVGSTYGVGGVTVAVRIGFDDARSLGLRETGSRAALPVFQEVILRLYQSQIVGLPPPFPPQMERRITRYVTGDGTPDAADATSTVAAARDDTIKATPSRAAARKRMVGSTSAP